MSGIFSELETPNMTKISMRGHKSWYEELDGTVRSCHTTLFCLETISFVTNDIPFRKIHS